MTAPSTFTPREIDRFREIVGRHLGLAFHDERLDELTRVLSARIAARGCGSFDSYAALVDRRSRDELRALAAALTVAETHFFRYGDQFKAFAEAALPDVVARAERAGVGVRVLSAGCASGEEPYSIAMVLHEHAAASGVPVVGIDVNPAALARARRARYTAWALRDMPDDARRRYLRSEGAEFRVVDEIRSMVAFEERNLVEDDRSFWTPAAFDVVFCRNVLMYFEDDVVVDVVARVARSLAPGGFLFLGHAETLRGISHDFHLRHTHATFYYQRRDDGPMRGTRAVPSRVREEREAAAAADVAPEAAPWVGAIERAAARIERLTAPGAGAGREADLPRPATAAAAAPSSYDLGPVVDLLRRERFAEAMALLDALPASAAPRTDVELLRAVLLANSGRLEKAERTCAAILAADELHAGAHYLTALCRDHAGDRRGAIEHDESAAYLDATFAMPHLHLGLVARRAGDPTRARAALERALDLLAREDVSRILLFGGGFDREALVALCRAELRASGGGS